MNGPYPSFEDIKGAFHGLNMDWFLQLRVAMNNARYPMEGRKLVITHGDVLGFTPICKIMGTEVYMKPSDPFADCRYRVDFLGAGGSSHSYYKTLEEALAEASQQCYDRSDLNSLHEIHVWELEKTGDTSHAKRIARFPINDQYSKANKLRIRDNAEKLVQACLEQVRKTSI